MAKQRGKKDYGEMTVEELHAEASARNLAGRSGLNKEQLTAALSADDEQPASVETGKPTPPARPGGAMQDTRKSADPTERPPDKPTPGERGDEEKDDRGGRKPKFGTAREADLYGEIPRVVDPNDRVPAGSDLVRFKVRADHYMGAFQPVKYILAHDEDEAREHYLSVTGSMAAYERTKKAAGKAKEDDVPAPVVDVKELPD